MSERVDLSTLTDEQLTAELERRTAARMRANEWRSLVATIESLSAEPGAVRSERTVRISSYLVDDLRSHLRTMTIEGTTMRIEGKSYDDVVADIQAASTTRVGWVAVGTPHRVDVEL